MKRAEPTCAAAPYRRATHGTREAARPAVEAGGGNGAARGVAKDAADAELGMKLVAEAPEKKPSPKKKSTKGR